MGMCPVSAEAGARPGDLDGLVVYLADGTARPFPLERTNVSIDVSAFVATTTIEQTFVNPFEDPVEAVFTFPLLPGMVVRGFELQSGLRLTRGEIHEQAEARAIYTEAKAEGYSAALIEAAPQRAAFTQSVANLMPGHAVQVRLKLVSQAAYDHGRYSLRTPLPNANATPDDEGSDPVERCDAAPVILTARIAAGVPIHTVDSETVDLSQVVTRADDTHAEIRPVDVTCHADLQLGWDVAAESPELGLLTHRADGDPDGYFTLLLQPKGVVAPDEAMPKEILFVLDVSGSMSGTPLDVSKRFVERALTTLGPRDRFNLIKFAGGGGVYAKRAQDSDRGRVDRALRWLHKLQAGGGTRMLEGLRAAMDTEPDPERFRMIVFLTDGHIGDYDDTIKLIRKLDDVQVHTVGIGSVNETFLQRIADAGDGTFQHVTDFASAEDAIDTFADWVTRPYLTDLTLDWGGLPVEVFDEGPWNLFNGQTLSVVGRYLGEAEGTIWLQGRLAGAPWEQSFDVDFPEVNEEHAGLGALWAERRIAQLLDPHTAKVPAEVRAEVVEIALDHEIVTDYTSFVAVDYTQRVHSGEPTDTVEAEDELAEFDETVCERVDESTAEAEDGTSHDGALRVVVRSLDGTLLPGAAVSVRGRGVERWVITDRQGKALFDLLPEGEGVLPGGELPRNVHPRGRTDRRRRFHTDGCGRAGGGGLLLSLRRRGRPRGAGRRAVGRLGAHRPTEAGARVG